MTILVADVGGTNTRVGLARDGRVDRRGVARFRNVDFAGLGDVLMAYLTERNLPAPETVCVAIAGPVRNGKGRLTNRDWIVSDVDLARATGARNGLVLNDLSAQGYALDVVPISRVTGPADAALDPGETRLVVGIGTGFNAAPVFCTSSGPLVVPSECGHVTLPVWNAASAQLSAALTKAHGFASVEDVLSGRGLPQSYRILTGEAPPDDPADILNDASSGETTPASETVATIIGAMGRVIGDLSLVHLPFGGVVLIGGMARAFVPYFERFDFLGAMQDKGRFSDFLNQFNVFILDDDFAALDGCAIFAS